MGMEGLWNFRRGRYSFQNFLLYNKIDHCVSLIEAIIRGGDLDWHEPSSHVAAFQADGKVHVYPGDL